MKVSLIFFIIWLFSVFQRWTHYSFSSWKWVWRLFRGLKLWIHDSPTKCKTMILCVSPSTNPALDALGNTGLNSDQLPAELYFRCGCASSLAARAGGLDSCTLEASCGVVVVVGGGGGGLVGLHPFCFVVICLCPSLPPIFSLIWVYFGLQHFISLH